MKKSIFVVSHKEFLSPEESMYLPISVGGNSIGNNNHLKDNTKDNISYLNDRFCELTAIYWIWKNYKSEEKDIIGICHYRRYFKGQEGVLKESEVNIHMDKYDLIIPRKRNYFIIKIKDHYGKAHDYNDLQVARVVIERDWPQYMDSYEAILNGKTLSLYNMLITRYEIFNEYCEWVFDILFKMEKIINVDEYDHYQKRLFGFLSERLFNVWLHKNKSRFNILELPVFNTDGESIIKKGTSLIKRQFFK